MKNAVSIRQSVTQEYCDLVNQIIPNATAEGAYCIGLVSALGWQSGMEPTRQLLEAAAGCKTLPMACELFRAWKEQQKPKWQPWLLDLVKIRPKTCGPDRATTKPIRPRCLLCGNLLEWGELYRATSSAARAKGNVVHEACFQAAKSPKGKMQKEGGRG